MTNVSQMNRSESRRIGLTDQKTIGLLQEEADWINQVRVEFTAAACSSASLHAKTLVWKGKWLPVSGVSMGIHFTAASPGEDGDEKWMR